MVTDTVLAATKFRDFLCARYNVTSSNLKKNATAAISPFPYVTELATSMEDLSSQVTTECVTVNYCISVRTLCMLLPPFGHVTVRS